MLKRKNQRRQREERAAGRAYRVFCRRLFGVFRLRQCIFSGKMRAAFPTMVPAESGAVEPPPALYKAAYSF